MESSISKSISVTSPGSQPLHKGQEAWMSNSMYHQPCMHLRFNFSFLKASPRRHMYTRTCLFLFSKRKQERNSIHPQGRRPLQKHPGIRLGQQELRAVQVGAGKKRRNSPGKRKKVSEFIAWILSSVFPLAIIAIQTSHTILKPPYKVLLGDTIGQPNSGKNKNTGSLYFIVYTF